MASAGSSVNASNFNALFTRLETVRANQYNRADLTSTQRSNISARITGPAAVGAQPVPSNVSSLKTSMEKLVNNGTGISSSFSSSITIPTVGELLKASTVTLIETAVTNAEGVCARCSFFSSNFTSHHASNFGHNSSNFSSNFGSNFSSFFTNQGFNNSRCANFGNFTANCTWFQTN